MLSKDKENKLNAYFGFARKMKKIVVGIQLEGAIKDKKVHLLIFLDECSEKNEEKMKRHLSINPTANSIRLSQEDFPLKSYLGYDSLKAVGILDASLAGAIYKTISE